MTSVQPNQNFSKILKTCGLSTALIICEGEICADQLQGLSLQDCLEVYRKVNTAHTIIPDLEQAIMSQCHSFKDWQKVYETSATKDLHDVALIKMCELAQHGSEFHFLMYKINNLDDVFIEQIFEKYINESTSFSQLQNRYSTFANNNNFKLDRFRKIIISMMVKYAQTSEDWRWLYDHAVFFNLQELVDQAEQKLIDLNQQASFKECLHQVYVSSTKKLSEFLLNRMVEIGSFQDWFETLSKSYNISMPEFWKIRSDRLVYLASNLKEWFVVYRWGESKRREEAKSNLIIHARTFSDWAYLYKVVPLSNHNDTKFHDLISKSMVETASTWQEWDYLLGKLEHKDQYHDQILNSLLALDNSLEIWADIIKWASQLYNKELQQKIIKIAQTQLKA